MATKKAVATKKKAPGKALMSQADMEKAYEAEIQKEAGRLPVGASNMLSIKGGTFTYRKADLGDSLEVVVLGFTFKNMWYGDVPFDPDNQSIPSCYAINAIMEDLAPHPSAPEIQHDDCGTCPQNEFGTDIRGKGKSCRNTRLLAVVAVSDLDNPPEDIEVVLLSVPPGSITNFDKYAKGLHKVMRRPLKGVITKLFFDDKAEHVVLKFEAVAKVESPAVMQLLEQKFEEAQELLEQPYDATGYIPLADRQPKRKNAVARAPGGGGRSRRVATAKEAIKASKSGERKSKFSR